MKIAFITESFPELSETFILGKVVELKKRGHQVTVFSQFLREHQVHPDLLSGIRLDRDAVRLPVYDRVRAKDVGRAVRAAGIRPARMARLYRNIRKNFGPGERRALAFIKTLPFLRDDYDLIHAHYAYVGVRYQEVIRALGLPLVVSLLGTDASMDIPADPVPYQELFRDAAGFIAVVEFLKEKACAHGLPPDKVTVIPTEVDTGFFGFTERGAREGRVPVVLSVGRLDWTKGYLYALEAMAMLRDRGVNFIYLIVGEGRGHNEVSKAVEDFGLEERVKMLGALDRDGVRKTMADADVFMLASVIEGIGGVLLEAQSTGLPVVATRVGGLPEVVRDNETGLLVPSRNPSALADAVAGLIARPDERIAMGRRARQWVVDNFDMALLTDRLESLYQEVVEKWKARP